MSNRRQPLQSGQSLVTLLIFAIITIAITSASVAVIIANSQASANIEGGQNALNYAEAGVENALIRLIRDPDYGGETILMQSGHVTVVVGGASPSLTVTAEGHSGNFIRTVEVQVDYTNDILSVTSWKEQ